MDAFVIDVNVALTANGKAIHASDLCQLLCIKKLRSIKNNDNAVVCIDLNGQVFKEYRSNLSMSGSPGVGDEFLYWLYQNIGNSNRCELVSIHECIHKGFVEFPDDPSLANFDMDDRKYVAVAVNSIHNPHIINAVDSDWYDFQVAFARNNIIIEQLCPDCL